MANLKGIRFTSQEREKKRAKAVKIYTEGATLEKTADAIGCSTSTVRNFLIDSGVAIRRVNGRGVELPDGMITAAEAAALIGVGHASLNSMRHRGYGPPLAERPHGAHGHYTYYWRTDVEQWIKDRAELRVQRVREREERRTARARALEENAIPGFVLDWEALMAACDAKRAANNLSWQNVCRLSGIDPAHISRIRRGYEPEKGLGAFMRLAIWVTGWLPEEIKRFTRPATDVDEEAS